MGGADSAALLGTEGCGVMTDQDRYGMILVILWIMIFLYAILGWFEKRK